MNPGPTGIGVAMIVDGEVVATISRALGHGTNNTAEQHAVLAALELARERGIERPRIYTDSQLVVRQVSGEYSTRPELLEMRDRIAAALRALNGTLEWIVSQAVVYEKVALVA